MGLSNQQFGAKNEQNSQTTTVSTSFAGSFETQHSVFADSAGSNFALGQDDTNEEDREMKKIEEMLQGDVVA